MKVSWSKHLTGVYTPVFNRDMNTNQTHIARTNVSAVTAQVGQIVSYEDMSNPAAFYTVIGHVKDAWGTEAQLVSHSTGRVSTSSLRQAGWVLAGVA